MNKSGTVTPLGPGIRITQVHAEHSSELVWHNVGGATCRRASMIQAFTLL